MVTVSKGMFNKAIREYARFAVPCGSKGEVWEYFRSDDRRVGMLCGVKCWLEDEVVQEMSTADGQISG